MMLLVALFPLVAGAQGEVPPAPERSEEEMAQVIERGLQRAASQSLLMANSLKDRKDLLPRTYENGELKTDRYGNWVSGFFPGVLWMLYENSGDNQFRTYAELFTDRVEPAKKLTNTHDLGFMLYCSFGQGYRLTGNRHYLDVINEGTQSLLTRWNPKLGVIRSWDFGKQWQYPVIIDNMMNLEMLCFMTHQFSDPRYQRRHTPKPLLKTTSARITAPSMWYPTTPSPASRTPRTRRRAMPTAVRGHADRPGDCTAIP